MLQDYFLTATKEITDVNCYGQGSYLGPHIPFYDFWILYCMPYMIVGGKKGK